MPVIMKDNVQYGYTTKGTVFHTLSNAEYEALTEEEKMNGDVYCIPDREPVINPDQLWEKVGTGTLDIGDDLTDGVNQLNSGLTNLKTIKTHTWTITTNNNGVTAIPQNICKPSKQILLAIYCGNGSYGYYRTDTISSDMYGICVIDLTKSNYTRVTNTTLTFMIAYIDVN